MSVKRRDNRNRILNTGESQRKDGRYAYKYIDAFGEPQFVYAWKLVPTDKTPAGKREDISLREKEKEIQKDLDDGINTIGKKMTVCDLYLKEIKSKPNVKQNTKKGRERLLNILAQDKLGSCSIDSVKQSDGRAWALRMKEYGYAYNTINNYKRSLKAAFYTAIEDDLIRKNPFNFNLDTVIEDDRTPKEPLSPEQETALLAFVENDRTYNKYYDEIVILLETGIRISELCGLTIYDVDLEKGRLNIDHQLLKDTDIGYYVDDPKTDDGTRQIPLNDTAYHAFVRVLKKRVKNSKINIDGYTDFLFTDSFGNPKVSGNYESVFRNLKAKFSKYNTLSLPEVFTPHTMRHTFCTNMANNGMTPNNLQYIMGHANIQMTLGYYAHASCESAEAEMSRICLIYKIYCIYSKKSI